MRAEGLEIWSKSGSHQARFECGGQRIGERSARCGRRRGCTNDLGLLPILDGIEGELHRRALGFARHLCGDGFHFSKIRVRHGTQKSQSDVQALRQHRPPAGSGDDIPSRIDQRTLQRRVRPQSKEQPPS